MGVFDRRESEDLFFTEMLIDNFTGDSLEREPPGERIIVLFTVLSSAHQEVRAPGQANAVQLTVSYF